MSCPEQEPNGLEFGELNAPDELLNYLRGQISDGVAKEQREDRRAERSLNGTFYQQINEQIEGTPELTKGSLRFILKPPHPNDIPGTYCEAYAVMIKLLPGDEDHSEAPSRTPAFILREFEEGEPTGYFFVDGNGVSPYGLDEVTQTAWASDPSAPFRLAHEKLQKLSTYNIVATVE